VQHLVNRRTVRDGDNFVHAVGKLETAVFDVHGCCAV
jgi:hypothetical protein